MRHSASSAPRSMSSPVPAVEPLENRQMLSDLGQPGVKDLHAVAVPAAIDTAAPAVRPLDAMVAGPFAHGTEIRLNQGMATAIALDDAGDPTRFSAPAPATFTGAIRAAVVDDTDARDAQPVSRGPMERLDPAGNTFSLSGQPGRGAISAIKNQAALHEESVSLPEAASDGSVDPPDQTTDGATNAPAIVAVLAVNSTTVNTPARGSVEIAAQTVPRIAAGSIRLGQDRLAVAPADARGFLFWDRIASSPSRGAFFGVPPEPAGENDTGREGVSQSRLSEPDANRPVAEIAPEPQEAGLLTRFLPLDNKSLEMAIDQFLGQFDDLGSALLDARTPIGLVPATLAVASALLACDVVIQVSRRCREEPLDAEGAASYFRFPGLPDLRSRSEP